MRPKRPWWLGSANNFSNLAAIKSNIIMTMKTNYVKALGTVDGDINFFYDPVYGFLARMLYEVSLNNAACEESRRSAQRFRLSNIMSFIIYFFVPVKIRYKRLFKRLRTIAIACLKLEMDKAEVFSALHTFLTEQHRISLTREKFHLQLSYFEVELTSRLKEPNITWMTMTGRLGLKETFYPIITRHYFCLGMLRGTIFGLLFFVYGSLGLSRTIRCCYSEVNRLFGLESNIRFKLLLKTT
jgi:hypothetical protein